MRLLGAFPDRHDSKDHIYGAGNRVLPQAAMLPWLPPIRDQGQQPSCTGHAGAWAWQQYVASRNRAFKFIKFSASFLWYNARLEENHAATSTGASLRSIMKVLNKKGCPSVEHWPEDRSFDQEPDKAAETQAAALRLPEYLRCEDLDKIKFAIAVECQSVLLSVPVFPSWTSRKTERTGRVEYAPLKEEEIGGHAVVACGYDDRTGYLTVANSWGERFGDNGLLHIPYELFDWEFFDAWTAGFTCAPDPT